jgi:hypothetical protein
VALRTVSVLARTANVDFFANSAELSHTQSAVSLKCANSKLFSSSLSQLLPDDFFKFKDARCVYATVAHGSGERMCEARLDTSVRKLPIGQVEWRENRNCIITTDTHSESACECVREPFVPVYVPHNPVVEENYYFDRSTKRRETPQKHFTAAR